jgi:uncharacterized hydantoinase/oxoprolinase family protein
LNCTSPDGGHQSIEETAIRWAAALGADPTDMVETLRKIINRAHQYYPDAATELRDRLNTRLRGEDPGTPLHWKGSQ